MPTLMFMISRRQFLALGAVTVVATACSDSTDTAATTTPAAPITTATQTTTVPTTLPPTTVPPTTLPPTTLPPTTVPPTTVAETTTTISIDELANAYTEFGPYPIGSTTLQLAKGPKVEIWYPAVDGTSGDVTYDVRDFTPDAIRALLTADIPATYTFPGGRDVDVADGSFPVVLFSHGFTGIRVQSSFLTAHLASWGFIVAAPDHPSRDLPNVLLGTASGDRSDSVDDLLKTLELVTAEGSDATSRFSGRVDNSQVVAVGHSAGGGTVVGAALDARVAGFVSLASGILLGRGNETTGTTTTTPAADLPQKPSLFMAGKLDAVVPVETVTRPSFEAAITPTRLWVVNSVGHNGFDDFCTFGNGTGIIGIADASGLGPLLDAQPQLRTLGQDGCLPPAVPVDQTFPIIRHAVTAWIRELFGIDAEPVGLGAEVAGAYSVAVEIAERL